MRHSATTEERVSEADRKAIMSCQKVRVLICKISYKMPLFKNPDAIIELLMPQSLRMTRKTNFNDLYHFQKFIPNLDSKAINKIFPLIPFDYQRYLILGLNDTQKAELQTCITHRFISVYSELERLESCIDMVKSFAPPGRSGR